MNVSVPQLRAFLAVVDEGGFGAAAVRLGISQSAVSHAVSALERALDGPVLERAGRVRATAFGDRIMPAARELVAAAARIERLADHRDGQPAGTVRLGAPPTACQGLLPGLLARWRTELPRVDVELFEGEDDEVAGWLASGTVDLAVLVDAPPARGVTLASDAFCALLRRDHPLAAEPAVEVAELADDPFLLSRGGCERHVRRMHRSAGVPFAPAHRVREMGTLLAMVRAGVGVSIVPDLAGAMLDATLTLVPVRPRRTRRLVLAGHDHAPPAAAAVLALARSATR